MTRWPISPAETERILRLKKKLKKNDPLHGVVEAMLSGSDLPYGTADIIVNALEDRRTRKAARAVASWAAGLAPMDPNDAQKANSALSGLLQTPPGNALRCCTATACCTFAWPGILLIPILMAMDRSVNEIRELAAISMGRLGFDWSLLPLSEAVRSSRAVTSTGDKSVRYAAVYGLSLVLRANGEAAAGPLDEATERSLCSLLREAPGDGVWCILDVLRISGSARSIRAIKRFLNSGAQPHLLEAASSTLAVLTERQAIAQQRASLLRPAQSPTDADHLLRPSTDQGTSDSSLLLRPGFETEQPEEDYLNLYLTDDD